MLGTFQLSPLFKKMSHFPRFLCQLQPTTQKKKTNSNLGSADWISMLFTKSDATLYTTSSIFAPILKCESMKPAIKRACLSALTRSALAGGGENPLYFLCTEKRRFIGISSILRDCSSLRPSFELELLLPAF